MAEVANTIELPAKPPLRFRRLKIAWTAFFTVLTVALCLLWVRSYWNIDGIARVPANGDWVGLLSINGGVQFQAFPFRGLALGWHLSSDPNSLKGAGPQFIWYNSGSWHEVRAPYWLFVMIVVVCAALPWLPFRFSLRTMLICTTLIAVVLGLIVWASRA